MMHKTEYAKDETSVWGKQKIGGYAGVKHTAKEIVSEIPNLRKYDLWVEPFSGLGRTADLVDLPLVLNDKSKFANEYCKEHFKNAVVENMDFVDTIKKYDDNNVFFLIDPPWRRDTYDENSMTFCDRTVMEYYSQTLKIVDNIKGDWFILSSADEHEQKNILRKSKWRIKIVESVGNPIFGKKARTMICSNLFEPEPNDLLCDVCGYLAENQGGFDSHLERKTHLEAETLK